MNSLDFQDGESKKA